MNTTAQDGSRHARTAVCCSGGGIRSASYCLGALEELMSRPGGNRPEVITAVSGGSYIAAGGVLAGAVSTRDGFRPGSMLETRLRNHTRYLVPDATQAVHGLMSLLWGAIGNLFLVGSLVYVVSALAGWLLAAGGGVAWPPDGARAYLTDWQVWTPAGLGCAAGAAFLIGLMAETAPVAEKMTMAERWQRWTVLLLAAAAMAAVLLVAFPELFTVIWRSGSRGEPGPGNAVAPAAAIPVLAAGAVVFAKTTAGTVSAWWSRMGSGAQRAARPWLDKARHVLIPWLGSLFVVAGLLVLSVFVLGISTAPDFQHWQIAAAAGIFLALHVMMDVNRSSMHDFYRDRLASAYAAREQARARLSTPRSGPQLVICAAANLRTGHPGDGGTLRGVPPGRSAVSCVFTPQYVELHFPASEYRREHGVEDTEKAGTSTYEDLLHDRMTLFDLVAISGAAVSPLMGKMTSAARRLLYGAVNLRLGVWVPRPSLVSYLDDRTAATPPAGARYWRNVIKAKDSGISRWDRMALGWRLASWDRVRHHNQDLARRHREHRWYSPACWAAGLLWRIPQPNLLLLWRETAGSNATSARWIYLTDGGHYDNLGLVEALRHQPHPRYVYVIDAGTDPEHQYTGLGQAIALARSELGVEVTLDPQDMDLTGTPPQIGGRPAAVARPFTSGTFQRTRDPRGCGRIDVIKLGVWEGRDLPWDVRAYYASHPTFPRDSTLRQLYDDEDFEAYRELGQASMRALLDHRQSPAAP